MPELSSYAVRCEGGLDLTSSPFSLLKFPGKAQSLVNMEPALSGGYKKIYGYSKFGTAQVSGAADTILGVREYSDGVFACADTGIWFTEDGITYIKVNKDGASAGLDLTALGAASELARSTTARYQMSLYKGSEEYGIVVAVNGVDKAGWIKFTGSGGSRNYFYKELGTTTGALQAPSYTEVLKDRVFLAGDITYPNRVVWSNRYEMDNFTGASAGSIDIADKITGIKAFREQLIIFGTNSIYTLTGFNGALTLTPITRNVGCIHGFTIQEFGGNLLFLARDGIRTVAATDRLGDLELGVVSRDVTSLVTDVINSIASYDISSVVIHKRNQYRLFYNSAGGTSRAIVGTLRYRSDGSSGWEWSEIEEWDATAISSVSESVTIEDVYHGGYDGYLYKEDTSGSYNGTAFKTVYKTSEIDLGDIGMRKTFHELSVSSAPEGTLSLSVYPVIDFAKSTVHQPNYKTFETLYAGSLLGTFLLGSGVLGGGSTPITDISLEGSGNSISFRFETEDTNEAFTLGGFFIDFIPSGRR